MSCYDFPSCSSIVRHYTVQTLCLENVYYTTDTKKWYDENRQPLILSTFNHDFEYRHYPKTAHMNITEHKVDKFVDEDILYLDYIYDFYNFGEFWDVVKRMLHCQYKNISVFHKARNR